MLELPIRISGAERSVDCRVLTLHDSACRKKDSCNLNRTGFGTKGEAWETVQKG